MTSFWSRILVTVVGAPIVLWIVWVGGWPLVALATLAALLAMHELYWITRTLRPVVLAGYLGAIGVLVGAQLGGAEWALAGLFGTLALAFAVKGSAAAGSVSLTLLGVGWVAIGLAFAVLLRDIDEHGVLAVYTVLLAVWAGDAVAYLIGMLLGRHKLAPTVSPGKTWEGLAAGTLATIAVTFIALYKSSFLSIPESLVLGAVIAVVSPLGDLFESAVKRDSAVKDSGNLLGGHVDRVQILQVLPAPDDSGQGIRRRIRSDLIA